MIGVIICMLMGMLLVFDRLIGKDFVGFLVILVGIVYRLEWYIVIGLVVCLFSWKVVVGVVGDMSILYICYVFLKLCWMRVWIF